MSSTPVRLPVLTSLQLQFMTAAVAERRWLVAVGESTSLGLLCKLGSLCCRSNTFNDQAVNKQKLSKEREVLQLRNKERSLTDELHATRAEVDQLTESLEHLKNQIAQSKHQITMIEMCKVSEDLKIGAHIDVLNEHMRGFQQLFDRDQKELEMRIKEQKEKEAKHLEELREQEKKLAEENERQDREVAAIEEECEAIEKECAVLKKRNNAIMLKLRKKLLEVENTRREVMKRNNVAQMINNKDNN